MAEENKSAEEEKKRPEEEQEKKEEEREEEERLKQDDVWERKAHELTTADEDWHYMRCFLKVGFRLTMSLLLYLTSCRFSNSNPAP